MQCPFVHKKFGRIKNAQFFALMLAACTAGNKPPAQPKPTHQPPLHTQVPSQGMHLQNLKLNDVPPAVKPAAHSADSSNYRAFTYTDSIGNHILVLTESETLPAQTLVENTEKPGSAHLSGISYLVRGGHYVKEWQIRDFVNECPVDIVAKFIPGTAHITDLDGNGVAEVWLMYATVCHGDVSPLTLKIIMHQGNKKYALRGESQIELFTEGHTPHETIGGNYKADDAFTHAPPAFLHHADSLWQANKRQKL